VHFLIYEEALPHTIYDFATDPIWISLCEERFLFFFISVLAGTYEDLAILWKILDLKNRKKRSQIIDKKYSFIVLLSLSLYSVFIVSRRGFVIIYLKSLKLEIYCTYKDINAGLGRTIHYDCLE
jgi:hypothetical protein